MNRDSAQGVLPIFSKFIFFDWYNTLSTANFWDSIIGNARHPLSSQMRAALEDLFRRRKPLVGEWMRGKYTDAEIIATLNVQLPARYRTDYLLRELLRDCRNAPVDPDMARIVRALRPSAFLAVASDNMACFVHAAPKVLSAELHVDELLVSSDVGSLKKEAPHRFFGPTLDRYGLAPLTRSSSTTAPTPARSSGPGAGQRSTSPALHNYASNSHISFLPDCPPLTEHHPGEVTRWCTRSAMRWRWSSPRSGPSNTVEPTTVGLVAGAEPTLLRSR